MKSLLFVCEDSSSINSSYIQKSRPGDRWFFGETEIIDQQNSALNIPLDNHNYRKFELDKIITYDINELSSIANDLADQCFINESDSIVISSSYSFGNNCPLLLEGSFNENNALVGPGLFLLISRSILSNINDQGENAGLSLYCSWNGILNSGEFTDMFEDLTKGNESVDMDNLSPISEEFGLTSVLKVESVNSLASIINNKRKTIDWKEVCHYIFTFRIFRDFNQVGSTNNNQVCSISLVSLGEGIKTRLSGQTNPWNALEMGMKELDSPLDSNFCMIQLSRYVNDYLEFPDLITIIYRFPFYISPIKPSHGKEIKFILSMLLFHQTFVNFISRNRHLVGSKSMLSDYSHPEFSQNSIFLQDFGYDSPIQITSYDKSSLFFNELNDAPIPPPNPISKGKTDFETQEYLYNRNISIRSEFAPDMQTLEEINLNGESDMMRNQSNCPPIGSLKYEHDALIQEIKILEGTLIDKNEIIIRLEKLIEARDQIIKQNQETIKLLKHDLNSEMSKVKELESKIKMSKGDGSLNHLGQNKHKFPLEPQRIRPSTAISKLTSMNSNFDSAINTPTNKIKNKDEKIVSEYQKEEANLNSSLTGVAKMAFDKFLRK
ncbi:hypothetical protein OIY81_3620 [Cryptosporidium canis]|nr:hypothetical protein OIY81_3620 [Cryptosporidium canis]